MDQGSSQNASPLIGHPGSKLPPIEKLTRYFEYLDRLRESGVTNMYGASPYLARRFRMNGRTAIPVLTAWMKTFSDEDASSRAQKAREVA